MTECIVIPFMPEFEERMLTGKKTATTRPKKYGTSGDLFSAFNHTFQLTKVTKVYLQDVCSTAYEREGFDSQPEFIEYWKQLHPRKGYVPEQLVWFHEFKLVV